MIRWLILFLQALVAIAIVFAVLTGVGKLVNMYDFWDHDPDRGAMAMTEDALGEPFETPVYLEQNWAPKDSLWFYNTTQGSCLLDRKSTRLNSSHRL